MYFCFPKHIKQHSTDNKNKRFLSTKSAYQNNFWRIMWQWKFSFDITLMNYILKHITTKKTGIYNCNKIS